eukprot:GFUD01007412.1.p1 GENE.GFUD01007412.1~~GFUD01007412.1.p1  ORF type:complete len:1065 (+),score=241.14 GFUD01007412.1:250-3444(+)
MEKKSQYKTQLQKFVRVCQYGVIGSLEKFFSWYGCLVATHPIAAILVCISVTIAGGLGLLRFYEEGDAASMVIPRHSVFRKNIDWLDENFPREIRVHSVVYTADNVLTPGVIQTIYNQRKKLEELTNGEKTFQDFCIQVPVLKLPAGGLTACKRGKAGQTTIGWDDWEEDDWVPFWEAGQNNTKINQKDAKINKSDTNVIENETRIDHTETQERKKREVDEEKSEGLFAPLLKISDFLLSSPADINIDMLEGFSDQFYPDLYCGCVEATETTCFEQNIIELWGDQGSYNEVSDRKIASLTEATILDTINNKNISQIFMKDFNFKELLGDVKYNYKGEIIGAGAVEMKFFTTVNVTDVKIHGTATRGEKIDMESYQFEGLMVSLLQERSWFPPGVSSFVNIQRQFFDSFVGQTFKDADKLVGGYILVFIYVNLMLSKLNCVEQRFCLSVVGILSVAMGMILGYGICSMFGLSYSAAHTVIPFLLLGIGIDNIFVITQTFNTIESSSTPATLAVRFGQTMKHAGVAVSVTTFTDVIAFFVGANTLLPGLQSFCVYAAVAIFCIYALQVTHFVAWFSLDQRRQSAKRDGCICCFTHKNFKSFEFSNRSFLNKVFAYIGVLLTKRLVQCVVMLMTAVFLVFGMWGTLSLTQEYLPEWLLPPESEVAKWFEMKNTHYPFGGEPGFIMIKQIDIAKEFDKFDEMVEKLRSPEQRWNINKVQPWHPGFRDYVNKFKNTNDSFEVLISNETYFRDKLTQFLFSPKGAIFQPNFFFSEPIKCGEPAPDVLLQAIPYSHKRFNSSTVWIPAMREVQRIVEETPFSNYSFPIALTYINWETDAIVGVELLRNVGIALICIFFTTLITLGSWRGSIFVMMCVLFTCIDVAGFMHWWGLTIEITSMNILIISVGLCVDFCAHIMHGFLTVQGSRDERVLHIMENIAPAVLNGGFSSILALSLLVTSRSHIFTSFFKIFFMICVFGLFHGLVMLPVVLCVLGPTDEVSEKRKKETKPKEENHFPTKRLSRDISEKYLQENMNNQETEMKELDVIVPNGVTESLLHPNIQEGSQEVPSS